MMHGKGVVFNLPGPSYVVWRQRETLCMKMLAPRFDAGAGQKRGRRR